MPLPSLHKIRKEILRLRKLARTTDSRKEAAEASTKAHTLLEALHAGCLHTFVVCTESEYRGSSSYDYDDRHGESRLCLACGVYETAYDEDFKVLATEPFARFERGGDRAWNGRDPLDYDLKKLVDWCNPNKYNNAYFYFGKEFHARAEEERKKEAEARRCKHCGCIPPEPPVDIFAVAKDSPLFKERPRTELQPF